MLQSPAEEEGKMGGYLQGLENFTPDVSDYDPAEVREVNLKRAQQLFKVIYRVSQKNIGIQWRIWYRLCYE